MGNNNASGSGTLPSNIIPNPRNECKGITTRSGVVLDGPLPPMPPPFVNPDNEKTKETEVTKDLVQPTSSQRVQPPVVKIKEKEPIVEPRVVNEPLKTKTNLPYPSRVEKDKNRERDDVTPRPKRVEVLQIWCDIKSIHNHNTSLNSGSLK
ncbi:hypothetical protein Tco_0100808 [Tanacetum coccineum]